METGAWTDLGDDALLQQALADPGGNDGRQAASELLGRYRPHVYTWCFRYVRDHEHALDMAQEVLVKAYRKLATFDGRSRFSSWLFAIARNRCLDELRRPALLVEEGIDPDGEIASPSRPDRDLEERTNEQEVFDLIVHRLDKVEQDALFLRCFERMPVDQITVTLGITETTGARAVLQRARRKLRSALRERRDRQEEESA